MSYMCNVCGYTYEGEDFLKEATDYVCPLCDAGKEEFSERNIDIEVCAATDEYHKNISEK